MNDSKKKRVSAWKEKAEFRLKNRKWLNYSSNIARRIAAVLEESEDLNQKKLAENLDVKPQYISKLLKGEENLTLETIAKLSSALGVELISFPDYKYSSTVPNFELEIAKSFFDFHIKTTEKVIVIDLKTDIKDCKHNTELLSEKKFSPQNGISFNNFIPAKKSELEMCN